MTPAVKLGACCPYIDAASYVWFDVTACYGQRLTAEQRQRAEALGVSAAKTPFELPLPFERMAAVVSVNDSLGATVVTLDAEGRSQVLALFQEGYEGAFIKVVFAAGAIVETYINPELLRRLRLVHSSEAAISRDLSTLWNGPMRDMVYGACGIFGAPLAYRGTPRRGRNPSKKLKRLFDWTTVTVRPPAVAPKKGPQGGTHASPRQHDRRGHMRTYKSGKQVWIKQMRVGKAKDGMVFHDYKVAPC